MVVDQAQAKHLELILMRSGSRVVMGGRDAIGQALITISAMPSNLPSARHYQPARQRARRRPPTASASVRCRDTGFAFPRAAGPVFNAYEQAKFDRPAVWRHRLGLRSNRRWPR
jgi:hypothetical protein